MTSMDRSHEQYAQFLTMGALATIAVAARLIARAKSKVSFGLDDFFAVLALAFYWTYIGVSLWGVVSGGGGRALTQLPLPEVLVSLKVLYVGIMFTVSTITAAKLSVLCLYYRIFQVSHKFKIGWMILLFATVAWFLTTLIMAIVRCIPIEAAWNPLIQNAKCYSLQLAFLITETINCVTDLAIVCLPAGIIRSLQLPLRLKIGLTFVFMLGGLVCVTSIIRIVNSYNSNASSDALLSAGLWVNIQLCSAIICACLPTYRPILPRGALVSSTLRQWYSYLLSHGSRGFSSHGSQGRTKDHSRGYAVSDENPRYAKYNNISDGAVDHIVLTDIKPGSGVHHDCPSNAINVETDLSSYDRHI